ncbi:MAG: hypothetical protein KDB01_21260 [Planctomycetaceae bacterium]|nr:hypothetical protein [Planctomycetaceae bacterium]
MITMSPTYTHSGSRPRASPSAPRTEPSAVPETPPPMRSSQLADLLDKVEAAEREKRQQDALALLGRLAAFD